MERSSKKVKTAANAAVANTKRPLTLYRQALKLIRAQSCGDDGVIQEKLQQAIAALKDGCSFEGQTVTHSLDLDLEDEPLFLLASAHLQLGLLLQRQDKLAAAQEQLQQSLCCFPQFAGAHSSLGQVLKSSAASAAELQQAQHHLQQAVVIAEQLQLRQGGLLVESNRACAAELEAADAARSALAMLLCQAGRDDEASPLLVSLGFKVRLSHEVLHYALPDSKQAAAAAAAAAVPSRNSSDKSEDSQQYLQVVDNALPAELLQHLQQAFSISAPFWSEHNYCPGAPYFSYFFRLDEAATSSMHQLARHLQTLATKYFPAVAEAKYAEFWAHCRRHASGHQLHFDSDDEGQGGVRNPIISTVLYLSPNTSSSCGNIEHDARQQQDKVSDACAANGARENNSNSCCSGGGGGDGVEDVQLEFIGGPTLVTDQRLDGPLATRGWMAYPAVNRLTMFDGSYLHGVVPGRGPSPAADGRRCTLMVAFWIDLKCRTPPGSAAPGACMMMPDPGNCQQQWPQMLLPKDGGWGSAQEVPVQDPRRVATVWQATSGGKKASGAAYDSCFQGF